MALSTSVRTKRGVVITVSDSGASNTITVASEEGNFTYTAGGYTTERFLDRTEHMTPRRGDAQVTSGSWTQYVTTFYSTTEGTMPDVCEYYSRTSSYVYGNYTSTLSSSSDAFSMDVDVTIDGTFAGEADVTLHFDDCQFPPGTYSDGVPSTYTCAFESSTLGPVVS